MISMKLQEALNAQVNAEMWSAYLYLAMSLDADHKGMKGTAHWMHKQFDEEMEHAFRLVEYMQNQSARVLLQPIAEVPTSWKCVVEMFEQALSHEKKVSWLIHNLCELALSEKDYATLSMLQWFVDEQVEEESAVREIIDMYKCADDNCAALCLVENSLLAR